MKLNYKGKTALAIGAHPDDVEFGCGATLAKLKSEGANIFIAVCTDGNRGSRQNQFEKSELVQNRKAEQLEAGKILGATEMIFLDEEDGNLIADIKFKEKIVKLIRKIKPDLIFTHDPSWFYRLNKKGNSWVNHTDHRACGEAVLDAVYPLSRDLQSFPEHMDQGLTPHTVAEVYLFHIENPNFIFDVTGFVESEILAILAHKSQIDHPEELRKHMTKGLQELGKKHKMKYAQGFIQLKFSTN